MTNISRDTMLRVLREATDGGAEEVHFKVPNRPLMRMPNGVLVPTNLPPLSPADVKAAVFALCALGHIEIPVAVITDHEFSFGINQLGRFRAYIYKQRGSLGAVVHRVNTRVPSLDELGLDANVERFVGRPGVLLVAGRQRIATMHALVQGFNARERANVVILESPLTYLHRDAMAAISHREVGTDVPDYRTGIIQAIRVGTNLVALGDIDEAPAAEAMLYAGERRVPVIAVVGSPSAEEASWFVTRLFYGQQREDIQRRLDRQWVGTIAVTDGVAEIYDPQSSVPQLADHQGAQEIEGEAPPQLETTSGG
ncbi:MAG: hypothetical protein AAGA48_26740 [Myxococcota bacterium]